MQYQFFALLFPATALAVPALPSTYSESKAESTYAAEIEAILPTYPSWYESVMETAIPTTWEMKYMSDYTFAASVEEAELSGTMPAWWSSLPSDVKYLYTSEEAVFYSKASTITFPLPATVTSTSGSSATSESGFTATATASDNTGSSTSTGGAPAATGGFLMSISGAAGILGLALVL
ncbi:hypothetical protein N7451_006291 [Penicillium sp. IBT 35674x]|nr:hypothetical protein N7451_006291 [Penicillium sp. IBT 35674x]